MAKQQMMGSDPRNATPSYDEMGKKKPVKKGRNTKAERPIRVILCAKCKQGGGTMVKKVDKYFHTECLPEEK